MSRNWLRTRKTIAVTSTILLTVAVFAVVFHFERTVHNATLRQEDESRLAFQFSRLQLPPDPGFEVIASPTRYSHAVAMDGDIFLSSPSELTQYRVSGVRRFVPGHDLVSARLGAVVMGRLRGAQHPQLLVATEGAGVLIYDRETSVWQQFLPQRESLRDVTALAVTSSGDLLFGTRRSGLLLYDGRFLSVYRPEYRTTAVTVLLADGSDIWVGTQDDGIFHTHGGVTEHFQQQLPDSHVETLIKEGDRVYAGTAAGVEEFVSGVPARALAVGSFARALSVERDTLLVAAVHEGTLKIPLGGPHGRPVQPEFPGTEETQAFVHVPGEQRTFSLRHDGLYSVRPESSERVVPTETAKLTDGNISALGFSPEGKLWVGYFDRGLDIFDPNLATARHLEDDHLFCVNRIVTDPERRTMAVATANGLVLFDAAGKPRQVLGRRDGLIAEHVTDITYSQGQMIVATPAGLSFVRNTGIESLFAFQGLVNNHVYALAVSADGSQLMAGTLGGMSVLQHDAVLRNLTVANSGLQHNWITAIVPVPQATGENMVGTYGKGVMLQHKDGSFEAMEARNAAGLIINPNAMLATALHVFAGSLNGGLWSYSFSDRRWNQITAGLPSQNVTALAEQNGMLYVGTENGLVRIAEARLPQ